MNAPYPSGTAVLLKEAGDHFEILLLRRNTSLSFHGGAWVFPGGRVDPNDFTDKENDIAMAARNAAVRETREEAGVEILPESMILMSRWTTPEGLPKRFTAWFFATGISDALVRVDGKEIVEYCWIRPEIALDAHRGGEMQLPPPTFVTILAISEFGDIKTALSTLAKQPYLIFDPRISQTRDGVCFLYKGDAGYDMRDANQPGARHRLWVFDNQYTYERSG